ncbi:hypothetical protein H4582DRAFT_109824 [Lactarius indigo]|nr:hypothetical protein H4582DRAFT_109824 [Lactarius indigo]
MAQTEPNPRPISHSLRAQSKLRCLRHHQRKRPGWTPESGFFITHSSCHRDSRLTSVPQKSESSEMRSELLAVSVRAKRVSRVIESKRYHHFVPNIVLSTSRSWQTLCTIFALLASGFHEFLTPSFDGRYNEASYEWFRTFWNHSNHNIYLLDPHLPHFPYSHNLCPDCCPRLYDISWF